MTFRTEIRVKILIFYILLLNERCFAPVFVQE
jgi:hypothetical protein